jgi:hypothetical protein
MMMNTMVNRKQGTKAKDEYASFFCTNKSRFMIIEHSKSIVFWNNISYMMTHQFMHIVTKCSVQ